jgi:uncharacterized membrane protein
MDDRTQVFTSSEALRFGWDRALASWRPLLVVGLASGALSLMHQAMVGEHGSALGALALQLLQALAGLVMVRVLFKLHEGQPVDLRQLTELSRGFLPYLLTSLLVGLMVGGGLVLLIVPGVWLALRSGFAPLLSAEQGTDPLASLHESARLTEGVRSELFTFGVLAFLVNLAGALALGLGLLLTVPATGLAAIHVLRRLQARAGERPSPTDHPLPPLAAHPGAGPAS